MTYTTLVATETLAAHIADLEWVVVDTRSSLADLEAGRRAYQSSHIPGAVFADLAADLSDPPGHGRGRHPLPTPERVAGFFGSLGIGPGVQVVAYDDGDGMYASRLWWMLRFLGHDEVAVLDGGFAKWIREGRATAAGSETRAPRVFVPATRREMLASAADVEAVRLNPRFVLVDSRSPDRYRGENETIDPVAGHIPGAMNHFFKSNVGPDGTMRGLVELAEGFDRLLGDHDSADVVVYCGSGVTACQNLLALEHAGRRGARLYAGSWSEWISDPNRPIATGADDESAE